ncbi:MAG: TROVE domain-containing protein [Thermonemataceae bacterium]|nr:TROVE domain-containing protein [Thermonemataceae bacterium]
MKFNKKTQGTNTTQNYEGEKAYLLSPAMDLYTAVVTSVLSEQFYEKADKKLERIKTLLPLCEPTFVAKLAIYAREQMNLRTIPLVLAVELAKIHAGDQLVSKMLSRIIKRADEITELLAYYQKANTRTDLKKLNKLSKQIQKGLAYAFNQFDEYQFAKYNRATEIKLRDALFLVHPKAKDEAQQAIFDKIVRDELETPYTWEVELSVLGQKGFDKKEEKIAAFKAKWEELIDSGKIGYMATLRNLRNILEANVSEMHIQKVVDYLSNEKAVLNSKQFPFRFLAAYKELKELFFVHTAKVLDALEKAIQISAASIKGFDEQTNVLLACDVSGSMQSPISKNSKVQNFDIGLVLAMLLQNRCKNVVTGMFGDSWKVINVPKNNILANVMEFHRREGEVGYATNGYLVLKDLIAKKVLMDKVMLFTDCQLWNSNYSGENISTLWNAYKKMAPKAKLYLFDLAGYGQTPLTIEQNDVFLIAG